MTFWTPSLLVFVVDPMPLQDRSLLLLVPMVLHVCGAEDPQFWTTLEGTSTAPILQPQPRQVSALLPELGPELALWAAGAVGLLFQHTASTVVPDLDAVPQAL